MQGILEYYASQRQLVQITDQGQQSYKDPILQAKIQANHLKVWLENNTPIPIEFLVVSTNPATVIKNMNNDREFNGRFITLENLTFRINEIYQSYKRPILNQDEMISLTNKISGADTPLMVDLIDEYGVMNHHLIEGIPCSKCDKYPLERINNSWICSDCGKNDWKVHEQVIFDYFLLHGKTIINRECRNLLKIQNRHVAYRTLKTMQLKTTGQNKAKKYISPKLQNFPQTADHNTKIKILQNQ